MSTQGQVKFERLLCHRVVSLLLSFVTIYLVNLRQASLEGLGTAFEWQSQIMMVLSSPVVTILSRCLDTDEAHRVWMAV